MTVTVATATPEHVPELLALMEEMDQFYGDTTDGTPEERADQLRQALFGDPPAAYALVAVNGDEVVGFAAWSFLWPVVGLTRSLYLKELYVTRLRRRSGVGTALMRAAFEVAAKHHCSRVEWTTDADNPDAAQFYAKFGLQQLDGEVGRTGHVGKLSYRLTCDLFEGSAVDLAAEAADTDQRVSMSQSTNAVVTTGW